MADKKPESVYSAKPPATRLQYRGELGQNFTPATPAQMERLEAAEVERAKFDNYYITEEKAAEIPNEVLDKRPDIRDKIQYSQSDWPSRKASATRALGPLEGGCGETVENRRVTFEQLTAGDVGGDPSSRDS